jgi:DNA replication protein DnaC
MTTEIKERIVKYSKELRLPTFRGEFEVHASEAAKQEASYEEYLLGLMEKEYYTRVENRKKSQIRQAGFPQKHYLHDLQKELLPDNARQKLPLLERLDFIKEGRNVVLAGNPGTGKTHIATGLGIKACQHNYKVLFTTVPRLITQLRESHSEHTLRQSLSDHRGRHCLGAGKGGGLPGPPGEGRRPEQPQCDVYGQYEDAFQRSTRPALPAH